LESGVTLDRTAAESLSKKGLASLTCGIRQPLALDKGDRSRIVDMVVATLLDDLDVIRGRVPARFSDAPGADEG
jgi:hypothetical protein